MGNEFSIEYKWVTSLHEPVEEKYTSAMMAIGVGSGYATRNEDVWSRTVNSEVRLSAYPLAAWLATSWWRLLSETIPLASPPTLSWRMAHEMPAAGNGYLWPNMVFVSDGNHIRILATQSKTDSKEAVRYLSDLDVTIEAATFEQVLEEFINSTLARLNLTASDHTPLHALWRCIMDERQSPEARTKRRLEAMLGFDPGECPNEMLALFLNLISEAGSSAVGEIAPACATSDPAEQFMQIKTIAGSSGFEGRFEGWLKQGSLAIDARLPAWESGWQAARSVRETLGLNGAAVSDIDLSELLGIPVARIQKSEASNFGAPIGLATQKRKPQELRYFLRKQYPAGRRFELARILCDYLCNDNNDQWFPVTDAKTARQKIQRSFAAEFLCPIETLKNYLEEDFSEEKIEDAAAYFAVTPLTIQTHLVNNGLLPVFTIDNDQGWLSQSFKAPHS